MKRLKGPELKKPDVKVPPFLADIYYDLRERRLLPLVALVVVAIAAIPFLLGSSEEALPRPIAESPAEAAEEEIADGSTLTVVEAHPGLRDYRKRLRGRTPTDPFKQQYTSLPEDAQLERTDVTSVTDVSGGGSSETSVTEVDESVTEVDETTSPPSTGGRNGTPPGPGRQNPPDDLDGKRLFGFRPDVRFGVAGSRDLSLHTELPLGTLLPKENAVVLFVGVSQSGKRAIFSVAPDIEVRGDGGCVGGADDCRFLSMREGEAVDLLTDSAGPAFRLKVESIEFVELDLPPKSKRASGSRAPELRQAWALGFSVVGQFDSPRPLGRGRP
jgi:hypothetical protein